ncbi:MAG TPA: GlsB/YeaQ/YmgE family stress response membrane protein [Gammaproteobacteria bacterium]|jgi:uncharacterized membrane protein YeaQ/YmgE (transglycosylase-associated protein family)
MLFPVKSPGKTPYFCDPALGSRDIYRVTFSATAETRRDKKETRFYAMMTLAALIWMLVIGAIAGWLAGLVMKGRGFGILGNIVIGIVGAVIGGFLFNALGIAFWGLLGTLLVAFIGAVILLFIVGLIKRA